MKLNEYFKEQNKTYVPETQKFLIYEKFIEKKNKKKIFRTKYFLQVRALSYSVFVIALVFGMYGTYLINTQENTPTDLIEKGVFVQQTTPLTNWTNWVNANYIANIVHFVGDFHVEHNGESIQTSNIHDSDTVILTKNTELIFHIDTGTQAKIIWPAKFTLYKTSETNNSTQNSYRIELHYGDFVEIQSLQETSSQDIEIVADDITVRQEELTQRTNFQLIKKWEQHIVKNSGSKLSVSKKTTETETIETQVEKEQFASIEGNDITVMSRENFNQAIKNKDISQKFTLNGATQDNTPTSDNKEENNRNNTGNKGPIQVSPEAKLATLQLTGEDLLTGLLATSTADVDQYIIEELAGVIKQWKQVLSPKQNNNIRGILNSQFLMSDIKKLYLNTIQSNSKKEQIAYTNIENKIQQLYLSFEIMYTRSGWRKGLLQSNISSLKTQLEADYHLPPKYLHNLTTLGNWIQHIYAQTETWLSQEAANIAWTELLNNRPSHLRFK